MEHQFMKLCEKGDLVGAQQLLNLNLDSDTSLFNIFCFVCYDGNLELAKWLLTNNPSMNISAKDEKAFCFACQNGHLELAKWLLQVKPDINISAKHEQALCFTCQNGHLHVVEWLLQVKPTINISTLCSHAFYGSCTYGHLHVAQWLQSLKPYLYVINYDEKGNYESYSIRPKKEANWEKRKYALFLSSKINNNLLYRLPTDVAKIVIEYV